MNVKEDLARAIRRAEEACRLDTAGRHFDALVAYRAVVDDFLAVESAVRGRSVAASIASRRQDYERRIETLKAHLTMRSRPVSMPPHSASDDGRLSGATSASAGEFRPRQPISTGSDGASARSLTDLRVPIAPVELPPLPPVSVCAADYAVAVPISDGPPSTAQKLRASGNRRLQTLHSVASMRNLDLAGNMDMNLDAAGMAGGGGRTSSAPPAVDDRREYADLGAMPKLLRSLFFAWPHKPPARAAVTKWEFVWEHSVPHVSLFRTPITLECGPAVEPTRLQISMRVAPMESFSMSAGDWVRLPGATYASVFEVDKLGRFVRCTRFESDDHLVDEAAHVRSFKLLWWNAVEQWTHVPLDSPPNAGILEKQIGTVGAVVGRFELAGIPVVRVVHRSDMRQGASEVLSSRQKGVLEAATLRPLYVEFQAFARGASLEPTRFEREGYLFSWDGVPADESLGSTDHFYERAQRKLSVLRSVSASDLRFSSDVSSSSSSSSSSLSSSARSVPPVEAAVPPVAASALNAAGGGPPDTVVVSVAELEKLVERVAQLEAAHSATGDSLRQIRAHLRALQPRQ